MSRFWGGVGLLAILAILALIGTGGATSNLKINDLETECREKRDTQAVMAVENDKSMSFKGHFPVENTNANLDFVYSQTGNTIELDVISQDVSPPPTFWNDCLASAVYDFDSKPLDPGIYEVEIKHDGERESKKIIRIE